MTIQLKIINEDTNPTRYIVVDQTENGCSSLSTVIQAGGEEVFTIHNTKALTISEQSVAAPSPVEQTAESDEETEKTESTEETKTDEATEEGEKEPDPQP